MSLRQLWFQVHLWLGVALFVPVIVVCVTGSYEVWQEEIDRLAHPGRYAVSEGPPLGPGAYLAAAQAAFGDKAQATAIRLPERAGDPVTVTGMIAARGPGAAAGPPRRPMMTAWIDPASGIVLDTADMSTSFRQTMHRLHGSLLIAGVGRKVVGWLGWALLASALTGIWLWWPRNGKLAKAFRFRRTPDLLLNLHYMAGFWIAIPLAVLALTGALISFPQTARGIVGTVAPMGDQPVRRGPPGFGQAPLERTALTADQAAQSALAAAPGASLRSLNLPTRPPRGEAPRGEGARQGAERQSAGRQGAGPQGAGPQGGREGRGPSWRAQLAGPAGESIAVTVSDRTGAARVEPARAVPAGENILRWNRRLHDGEGTGLVWKLVITVAGIVPLLLGVTGFVVWLQRQRRKAAMRRRLADDGTVPAPASGE